MSDLCKRMLNPLHPHGRQSLAKACSLPFTRRISLITTSSLRILLICFVVVLFDCLLSNVFFFFFFLFFNFFFFFFFFFYFFYMFNVYIFFLYV